MNYNNKVIGLNVLQGGKLVRKIYKVGRGGLKAVNTGKDHLNRFIIRPVRGYNNKRVVRSMPKVSSRDVMDSIGSSLGGMGIGKNTPRVASARKYRGSGVTLL